LPNLREAATYLSVTDPRANTKSNSVSALVPFRV
jgi:hypothetical protein